MDEKKDDKRDEKKIVYSMSGVTPPSLVDRFSSWKLNEKISNMSLTDVGKVGGGLAVSDALRRAHQQEHHNRHIRDNERTSALNKGAMNPVQYVSSCADDKLHPQVIKEKLEMWGKKWKGCDFAKTDDFSITPTKMPSSHGWDRFWGLEDESYRLTLHPGKKGGDDPDSFYPGIKGLGSPFTGIDPPDNPLMRSEGRGNPPMGWLHGGGIGNFPMGGLRNGYRPSTEQQIPLEERPEMTEKPEITRYEYLSSPNVPSKEYRYTPNVFCEVSEGYAKDFSDERATRSYLIRVPHTMNPLAHYPIGIGLVFTSFFVVERVASILSKWFAKKKSQKPISPSQAFKRPQGGEEAGEVSQESASSLKEAVSTPQKSVSVPIETVSVEEFKRLQGEKRELEAEKKQQTMVRPEFLLELFISYKQEIITKGAATRILMTYYHLSEAEALEWLDEK